MGIKYVDKFVHSGIMGSTVASQKEGPRFKPWFDRG